MYLPRYLRKDGCSITNDGKFILGAFGHPGMPNRTPTLVGFEGMKASSPNYANEPPPGRFLVIQYYNTVFESIGSLWQNEQHMPAKSGSATAKIPGARKVS